MNLAGGQAMAMYENDEIDVTGVGLFDLERVLNPEEPLNKELVVAPPGFSVSYIGMNASDAARSTMPTSAGRSTTPSTRSSSPTRCSPSS